MVKSYLLEHPHIFIGASKLHDQKFWHHAPTVLSLFEQLENLLSLKTQKDRAGSNAEKATLNTSIKAAIAGAKNFLPLTSHP